MAAPAIDPALAPSDREVDELHRQSGIARKLLTAEQEHAQALEAAIAAASAYCLAREQLHTARATLEAARRKAKTESIPTKPIDSIGTRCARNNDLGARRLLARLQESTRGQW
jgi:hypothetical protein